jgi:hypothetical protein
MALPVFGGSEDPLTEQAISFGLEGTVIDGLRFFYFTMRPSDDVFRACDADPDSIE